MTEKQERAVARLEQEAREGEFSQAGAVMKNDVCGAVQEFCRQSEEFARAVLDGSFEDCMKAVERGISHGGISDLEAFRRAAQAYFPGCAVEFRMEIRLSGHEQPGEAAETSAIIDLSDFL